MPEIGNSSVFSQNDASNGTGTMPSWLGSAAPSTLDDAGRALQGAVTREWNWRNVTLTTGGTSTAYTLTFSVAPAAYYNGQRFAFIVNATNTAAATLNVNSLGAKNLRKMVNGTATALNAGDLAAGAYCEVAYNTVGDYFVILNRDLSMLVPDSNANGFLRNRIINGDMRIDQRNVGASVTPTTSGTYTLDRWFANLTVASKYSVQQQTSVVPTGHSHALKITSLSAYSVGVAEQFAILQGIEGLNFSDFGFGTASAQSVTLSFWVYSSLTGTFGGSLQNGAANRSYPFTYSIPSANTWTKINVTIPGDTTGTWTVDNSAGAYLSFGLGVGTTLSGTASSWAAANYRSATGAVSVVGTNAATWYVTGVQLEAGSAATPFERRQYGQEFALCQRYYEKLSLQQFISYNTSNVPDMITGPWSVQKRATPTLAVSATTNINTATAFGTSSWSIGQTGAGGSALNVAATLAATAEL